MKPTETQAARDYRADFAEFEAVTYLAAAAEAPMPLVAVRAAQAALEWKKWPQRIPEEVYFDLPDRIRASVARLIGGVAEEVAVTAGATSGLAAVAHGIDWKPGDEVLVAQKEFPAHFCTWMPLEEAGRVRVKVVTPRERFITADDFIEQFSSQTRLVSTSLVRFDNAARLDAKRLAGACYAAGAYLLLDVSQCAGAMPMDARSLGADFLTCAGYKWLLSPYGTGFFWIREELIEKMRPAPFYWTALEGARDFHSLSFERMRMARGSRRWDSPETASFFNLAPMAASLEYVLQVGVETIEAHNRRLIGELIERLPRDRCVLASPPEAEQRGPFVCVAARRPEQTRELLEKLRKENIIVSLREGALRIAPYLYNTERDIARLIAVLSV
jgi:selenocysteine lyase/cysteine desulfurase